MDRYRTSYREARVTALSFEGAFIAGMRKMIEIEKTLDTPREHIRMLSVHLPIVDSHTMSQLYTIKYIIQSKYKVDYNANPTNKFDTTLCR